VFGEDYVVPCTFGELTGKAAGAHFNDRLANALIATVNGLRLLIVGLGDGGIHAIKPQTGEKVWSFVAAKRAIARQHHLAYQALCGDEAVRLAALQIPRLHAVVAGGGQDLAVVGEGRHPGRAHR